MSDFGFRVKSPIIKRKEDNISECMTAVFKK